MREFEGEKKRSIDFDLILFFQVSVCPDAGADSYVLWRKY